MTVDLTIVDLASDGPWLVEAERQLPRLGDGEAERLRGIVRPEIASRFAATHIALRLALELRVGPKFRRAPFTFGAHGKPELAGTGLSFNLAHSTNFALIAVSEAGPVGVDIEQLRVVRMTDARRERLIGAAEALGGPFNPAKFNRDATFLMAWTRLEAFAKATGEGIGSLLTQLFMRSGSSDSQEPVALLMAALQRKELRIEDIGPGNSVAPDWPALPDDAPVFAALALPAAASIRFLKLDPTLANKRD